MSKKEEKTEAAVETKKGIILRDPEVIVPKTLPLIVEPEGGVDASKPFDGWKNAAQQAFARLINAYAYKNPKKWKKKMGDVTHNMHIVGNMVVKKENEGVTIKGLLTHLEELGELGDAEAMEKFNALTGGSAVPGAVTFKDHAAPTIQ